MEFKKQIRKTSINCKKLEDSSVMGGEEVVFCENLSSCWSVDFFELS